MSGKKECGCGFGHSKKKSAFGSSANSFFMDNYAGPANINSVKNCLSTVYNNVTPLSRFGSKQKSSMGPMKIGSKKK
jgi:hypothetical protein